MQCLLPDPVLESAAAMAAMDEGSTEDAASLAGVPPG